MTTDADTNALIRQQLLGRFNTSVKSTADRLRDLADTLEREAARIGDIPTRGTLSASALAARLTYTVTTGVAAANVDAIVSAAAEYDHHVTYATANSSTQP